MDLQKGFVGSKMGDSMPRGEESYPTSESCSNQGSCYPSAVAVGLEAKFGQAWSVWESLLDTDGNTLML